jgi:hypothetical protein
MGSGSGVSMAAALRTVQRAPEIGDLDLISPALSSPSGWVRDQAYVVATRLPGANSVRLALLEIGLAFAEQRLLERLPRYIA